MADRDQFKLVTPEFRGSYVHLAKSRAYMDQDPKFSITIVLPKDDPFWEKVDELTDAAAEAKFGEVPDDLVTTVHDGDEVDRKGKRKHPPEFTGCDFVRASNEDRPGIIDQKTRDKIIDIREECYSGAWYRATVRIGAWNPKGADRRGVSVYLDNVMKVKDDESFSGRRAEAAEDFAEYLDKGPQSSDDERPRARRRARGGRSRSSVMD